MQQRQLGYSGLCLPSLTVDTRHWHGEVSEEDMRACWGAYAEGGGNAFFLSAAGGGTGVENRLGSLWRDFLPREQVRLIAHAAHDRQLGPTYGQLLSCLEKALVDVDTDYLDLWLLGPWDGRTPLSELLDAAADAIRAGKVRYAGVYGFRAWQVAKAAALAERALVAGLTEYSLFARGAEKDYFPACYDAGVGTLASRAAGPLTPRQCASGQGAQGERESVRGYSAPVTGPQGLCEALDTAAQGLGRCAFDVALSWSLGRPGVTSVLVQSGTEQQMRALLDCQVTPLPEQIAAALDEISRPSCSGADPSVSNPEVEEVSGL